MKQMMEMYDRGEIKAIQPMTIFESARIEDAMRFMQKGSHLGKVIVTLPESEENLTTLNAKQKFRLRSDASYFLVGGLGGLGQAIAIWMAEAGATESKPPSHCQTASTTFAYVIPSHFLVKISRGSEVCRFRRRVESARLHRNDGGWQCY